MKGLFKDKEKEENLVNYRLHGSKETNELKLEEFIELLNNNIKEYK